MEGKYQNGKIYRITDLSYTKFYYGSTCETLSQRMARHRAKYTTYLKGGITNTRSFDLFDEFGVENCKIELVELYPTNSKEELRQREGYYIQNNDCINKCVPRRTAKQHYHDNYEYCIAQRRAYKELHREEQNEYGKKRFQERKHILLEKKLCECGRHYTYQHYKRHIKSDIHKKLMAEKERLEEYN